MAAKNWQAYANTLRGEAPTRADVFIKAKAFISSILFVMLLLFPAIGQARGPSASISGEILSPGHYRIKQGERLSSLIARAGGYTEHAHLRGAVFTRAREREAQRQSLRELALRLEQELLPSGAGISGPLSPEEIRGQQVELAQKRHLVRTIRELQATGRITIRLSHLRLLKNTEFDLELEDGDHLHIPRLGKMVHVSGAVRKPGSYDFTPKHSYKHYIALAGGYTASADARNTFVLGVDGAVRRLARGILEWNIAKSRWEFTRFGEPPPEIEPGDTIVAPENRQNIPWLRNVEDYTQILMQLAAAAGFAARLF